MQTFTVETITADINARPANGNRASAGYSWDILTPFLGEGFYLCSGRQSHITTIGHRDNRDRSVHAEYLTQAADRLRSAGFKVRLDKRKAGGLDSISVIGPKAGGSNGSYSH